MTRWLPACDKKAFGDGKIVAHPSSTVFSVAALKEATKNFRSDALVGEGGFGLVYKGMLHGRPQSGRTETIIAVKMLNPYGTQRQTEWLVRIKTSPVPFSKDNYFALSITKPKQPKCMMVLMGACHAQLSGYRHSRRENSRSRNARQPEFIRLYKHKPKCT